MRAKKSLGQNFLVADEIIARIIDLINPQPGQIIVEIGPGRGALTVPLAESGATLIAVELDDRLASTLSKQFASCENVAIHKQNILSTTPDDFTAASEATLIGNLPYNITSPVLDWLFSFRQRFNRAILMMQKEVALRVTGRPGSKDWSPLAIFMQCEFECHIRIPVPPTSFTPRPAVDSAVVEFVRRQQPLVETYRPFERVVRQAFAQRRKTLVNNLCPELVEEASDLKKLLAELGWDARVRAEQLTIAQFHALTQQLIARRFI